MKVIVTIKSNLLVYAETTREWAVLNEFEGAVTVRTVKVVAEGNESLGLLIVKEKEPDEQT